MPVSRRQLECRVLDRSTTVTIEICSYGKILVAIEYIVLQQLQFNTPHFKINWLGLLRTNNIKFTKQMWQS